MSSELHRRFCCPSPAMAKRLLQNSSKLLRTSNSSVRLVESPRETIVNLSKTKTNRQFTLTRAMHIHSIPMCECCVIATASLIRWILILREIDIGKGTSNNYAYLVVDEKSRDAVIIDPANPPECDCLL
jgi:hypothetical protein